MSADKEPFSPDFRYETIIKTLKEVARGELVLQIFLADFDPSQHDTINRHRQDFGIGVAVFSDPKASISAREAVEENLFAAIMSMKVNGILKPALSRDQLVLGIDALDKRVNALTSVMKEILIILADVKEIVQRLDK
jgi:hypothetical protein